MALLALMHRKHGGDLGTWEKDLAAVFHTCAPPYREPHQPHAVKRDGFRRVHRIVQAASDEQLVQLEQKHLLWSALGLYCYFRLQYTGREKGLALCTRRRDADRSQRLYADVVNRLLRGSSDEEVTESMLTYLSEYKIWSREFLCIAVLVRPLVDGAAGATVLSRMLDRIQAAVMRNQSDTRHIIRVLYELLDFYFWPPLDEVAAKAMTRLLKMYRTGVRVEREEDIPMDVAGGPLRKGLEVAIRRIIEHMNNSDLMLIVGYMVEWVFDERLSDETILDFGTVLEHAALVHCTELYKDTFTHELFDNLFEIVSSTRGVVSHLGNRILHQLLDRNDNCQQFESPKIFFQNTHFNVTVGTFYSEDKAFIKKHRSRIHDCIMRAIINHAVDRHNLENIFTTICLLATEVPCGYTAAAITNLIMNVQEAGRHNISFRPQVQYHLHALVMGVMSLLCWLHNAPDFYTYVNKIINLRAEHAPHLNPPLRIIYSFAQHHVLWDKADLFFDDWEVRYCLWMRFKIKDIQTYLESVGASGPPTAEMVAAWASSGYDPSLSARVPRPTRRQELRPFLPIADGIDEERWDEDESEVSTIGESSGSGGVASLGVPGARSPPSPPAQTAAASLPHSPPPGPVTR